MNILIVSPDYPHKGEERFPFVKQLVEEFVKKGHKCTVLAPYNILHNKNVHCYQKKESCNNGYVTVIRPNYLSFGNSNRQLYKISAYFHKKAIHYACHKLNSLPDVIYCHFWRTGIEVFEFAKTNRIPLFIASGESNIKLQSLTPSIPISNDFSNYISGVICVSTKNKEESISLGLASDDKCIVLPNSVNSELFYKKDKEECRRLLNLPLDKFIISFVGWFETRKGIDRVSEAILTSQVEDIFSIFIGKGSIVPSCNNILYCGPVKHNQISTYLNAADVFVLPTRAEGCCNAIIEAMSCGLPIISSNLPFNWDVLNTRNSIMVDPNDIKQIGTAIKKLYDDKILRQNMAEHSLADAIELTIDKRANKILCFIESKIHEL